MRSPGAVLAAVLLALAGTPLRAQAPVKDPCALFTVPEIQKALGAAVQTSLPMKPGPGCEWVGADLESVALISVEAPGQFEAPGAGGEYQTIAGAGKRAYTHPETLNGEHGWSATALTERASVTVILIGATATRANAIALLRQLLQRL